MEENKISKAKGLSITMIILAIVVGFGFLIGLAQAADRDKLFQETNPEMEFYFFDENGRFLTYWDNYENYNVEVNIPKTYSLTSKKVAMHREATSQSDLTSYAKKLGIEDYTITDISGYVQNGNSQYYRTRYRIDFEWRKTITGTQYTTTIIGRDLFRNTSRYRSFNIPNTVKTVEWSAFCGTHGHTEIVFPEGVESLEGGVCFGNSNLKTISLPSTLKYIGSQAFEQCHKVVELVLPDSVETISWSSFNRMTKLETLTLSANLQTIASYSISWCYKLKTVNFKEGNRTIGEKAFEDCTALEEVNLPSTLTTIKSKAFDGCTSLNKVILNAASVVKIDNDAFPENVEKFYVKDEIYEEYLNSAYWTGLTDKIAKISEMN